AKLPAREQFQLCVHALEQSIACAVVAVADGLHQCGDVFLHVRSCWLESATCGTYRKTGASVRHLRMVAGQSSSVSSDALPPAAVVFTVTVFSVANRGR